MRFAIFLSLCFVPVSAFAAGGVAVYVQGTVSIESKSGARPVALGADIDSGETIVTSDASQVRVRLKDGSLLRIGPNARVELNQIERDGNTRNVQLKVVVGRLWASVSKFLGGGNKFDVDAGAAVAGVRGTELIVEKDSADSDAKLTTVVGSVVVRNKDGSESTVETGFRLNVDANGRVVGLVAVPGEELARLRDESRSNGSTFKALLGVERGARDVSAGAAEQAIGALVARFAKTSSNQKPGGEQGEGDAMENRRRQADLFGPLNAQAGSTELRINVTKP